MNKHNVVWIMIDSVRRYHSEGDDRSRLKFMDEFAKEGVEFYNCVTSAPSTIMSVSATMTSLPAYHLGRNYGDFQFDNDFFRTLPSILKKNGYETKRSCIMHWEVREKLRQFELVPKKYWPNDFSHRNWWGNDDINRLVHSVLEKDRDQQKMPSFWFIDYNCRNDENISDIVENTVRSMESAGFTKDNTVFMVSSDHGYPDPKRGISAEYLAKNKLSHDIFMTDDNIMIPLIIRYPGCIPGQKIDATISTLDLLPTILDILGIKTEESIEEKFNGISLLPLINGSKDDRYFDRKIRTDARFIFQPGRLTAIRGDKYKYVLHHDNGIEEFVYIGDNGFEEPSVIDSKDPEIINQFKVFKEAFSESELNAKNAQSKYAAYKLKNRIGKILNKKNGKYRIALIGDSFSGFGLDLYNELQSSFPSITFLLDNIGPNVIEKPNDSSVNLSIQLNEKFNIEDENLIELSANKYDLVYILHDSTNKNSLNNWKRLLGKMKYIKVFDIDLQREKVFFTGKFGKLIDHVRLMWRNKDFYKQEPMLLLTEPFELLKTYLKITRKYPVKPFIRRTFK